MNTYGAAMGFGQQGYLNPQQGVPEPQPISILEAQIKRLTDSAADIDTAANRLISLADHLLGAEATADPGKAGAPAPNPVTTIGKLNEAHEWLEVSRMRLAHAITRLERL